MTLTTFSSRVSRMCAILLSVTALCAQPQSFIRNYGTSPGWFPDIWRPYLPQSLPHPVLENSPRLSTLIHDGKLELSMSDALALTLENNLDVVIERYVMSFSQTDILRTKS